MSRRQFLLAPFFAPSSGLRRATRDSGSDLKPQRPPLRPRVMRAPAECETISVATKQSGSHGAGHRVTNLRTQRVTIARTVGRPVSVRGLSTTFIQPSLRTQSYGSVDARQGFPPFRRRCAALTRVSGSRSHCNCRSAGRERSM